MLTHVRSDSLKSKAVTIILSGNRPPINYFDSYDYRNVFIDGRLSDIGKGISYKNYAFNKLRLEEEFLIGTA